MRNIVLTALLFIVCSCIGVTLARHNPIENDESYSQHESIQHLSYLDILKGQVNEGNNCPLFYSAQKLFGQLAHFQLRTAWVMEQYVCEDNAQIMMRLLPILFMSAGISLCFYYFLTRYTIVAAVIAAALFLTTPITWLYWAQDRPYGLWILLTCAQTILLCEYFIFTNKSPFFWRSLTLTHWLLCLCSGFGLIQTLLAIVLIRKRWLSACVLPVMFGLFYALNAPKYHFRIPADWPALILTNISVERLALIAACACFFKRSLPLLIWLCALLGFGLLLIAAIYYQHTPGIQGFELSARYLLFLLPSSIIILNIFWQEMMRRYDKDLWVNLALIQALILVLLLGGWRTVIVLHRLL